MVHRNNSETKEEMDLDVDRTRFAPSPESPKTDEVDVNIGSPSRLNYEPESPRSYFQGSDDDNDEDMEIDEISRVTRDDDDDDMSDSSDGEQVEIKEELSTARPPQGSGNQANSRRDGSPAPKKRNMAPFAQDWIGGEQAVQRRGNRHPHPKDWIGGEVEDYLGKVPYMRPYARWKKGTEPDLRPKPRYGGGKKRRAAKKVYKKPVREPKIPRSEDADKDGWSGGRDKNYLPNSIPFPALLKAAGLNIEELSGSQAQEGGPKATEILPLTSLGELVGHLHIAIPAPKYGGVQDLRVSNLQRIVPECWPARLRTTEDHIYFDFGSEKKREKAAWCLYEALMVAFAYTVELIGFDGRVLAFRKKGAAVPEYYDRVVALKESIRGKHVAKSEQVFGYRRKPDHERKRDFAREREHEGKHGYYQGDQECNYEQRRSYDRGGDYDRIEDYVRKRTYERRQDYEGRVDSTRNPPSREPRPHPRKQSEITAPKKINHNLDLERPLPRKLVVYGEELLEDPRAKPDVKATFRWPQYLKKRRFGDPEKTSIWSHVQNLPSTIAS